MTVSERLQITSKLKLSDALLEENKAVEMLFHVSRQRNVFLSKDQDNTWVNTDARHGVFNVFQQFTVSLNMPMTCYFLITLCD